MLFVFILMVFLGLAPMGNAQNISVTSGEHEDFSRLVLTFSKPFDWVLAREASGYTLSTGQNIPNYDLSDAFRRLTNKRVTDIRREPMTGALYIAVNCECYAIPFELRTGILVIDIRDGTAPSGSSFELARDGTLSPPLIGAAAISGKSNSSSDVVTKRKNKSESTNLISAIESAARTPPALSPRISEAAMENTRYELLWQISKGAADGVVDVTTNLEPPPAKSQDISQNTNIGIGPELGITAKTSEKISNLMTEDGKKCFSNEDVDMGPWAGENDNTFSFSENTTGLVAEFDRPNRASIEHAVKYLLALGFGAEARALLKSFKVESKNRNLWEALSYLVDEAGSPVTAFQGMEVCNTYAALWAFLAKPEIPLTNEIETSAILRAFSNLPSHMRRHLGREIATRFLNRNDFHAAHAVKASMFRSSMEADASVQMLNAEIQLSNDEIESAELILGKLSGASGPVGIHSAVALIEAKVGAGHVVPEHLTVATEAMLHEAKGGENESPLRNALALAYASQNKYQKSFALIPKSQKESVLLWSLLGHQGDDNSLLSEAVVKKLDTLPELPLEVKAKISDRLIRLGFSKEAASWTVQKTQPLRTDDDNVNIGLEVQVPQRIITSNAKNVDISKESNFEKSAEKIEASSKKKESIDRSNMNSNPDRGGAASREIELSSIMKSQKKHLLQEDISFGKNEARQNSDIIKIDVVRPKDFVGTLGDTRSLVNQSSGILKDLKKLLLN